MDLHVTTIERMAQRAERAGNGAAAANYRAAAGALRVARILAGQVAAQQAATATR